MENKRTDINVNAMAAYVVVGDEEIIAPLLLSLVVSIKVSC